LIGRLEPELTARSLDQRSKRRRKLASPSKLPLETTLPNLARETTLAFLEALRNSPRPAGEIAALAAIFGYVPLRHLVGASEPSLRRYAAEDRTTPDAVAQRIHFLAQLVAILRGSFNEFGIRRWFERPHPALGGSPPTELLRRDFDPSDPRAQATLGAAAQLLW
jgi:hypothetical protein